MARSCWRGQSRVNRRQEGPWLGFSFAAQLRRIAPANESAMGPSFCVRTLGTIVLLNNNVLPAIFK